MPIASSLRSVVLEARQELQDQRAKLRAQHNDGSPGVQVSARFTELVDSIVVRLFDAALSEVNLGEKVRDIALIAHGGYGRRDLAPYSDLDLMLTPLPTVERDIAPLARRLSQDIVDAGLSLGFSVRTPRQACQQSWQDATVFTSLVESRLLVGSSGVFTKLMGQLRAGAQRRQKRLTRDVAEARMVERAKWGDTGYLLRPNVKRGRGALRDIQLVRWIGFACYGESDPDQLMRLGALSAEDLRHLKRALTFLLRLRNEMHFDGGKANDILDRPMQMTIAQRWRYPGETGMLPVEQFMREYFNITSEVRYASANFLDSVQTRSLLGSAAERIVARRVGSGFRLGPWHIWVPTDRLPQVAKDLDAVLELLLLAQRYRKRIDHTTWDAIRRNMRGRPADTIGIETSKRFMALLGSAPQIGNALRRLHELRVLDHFIPAISHARCLLQFNEYHKYTVDAHSIRAVQAAADLVQEKSIAGQIFRALDNRPLILLTLLLHDLGKGFEEDHSELGRVIARETGQRLHLESDEINLMEFLIHKHLRMADVAHRHDLNSRQIIESFGREVKTIRNLQYLLVHTIADLTAVGPDVLTDWKRALIEELYMKTLSFLQHGTLPGDTDPRLDALRAATFQALPTATPELVRRCLTEFPASFFNSQTPASLAADLCRIIPLAQGETSTVAWGSYDRESDAVAYTLVNRQIGKPIGTFARATGVLSSQGLEILRAEIHTIADSIAWDCFTVRDPDNRGEPHPQRLNEISESIVKSFASTEPFQPKFRKRWKAQADMNAAVAVLPTRVEFDNDTAPAYTVLSVFAYDRTGLLYDIARTLASAEIVLHFAKIATHFDQAADIFYITELDGSKVADAERQSQLRSSLLDAIGVSSV